MTRLLLALFGLMLAFAAPARGQPASIRQVYLVQNSGWMEPFYEDAASAFLPLVEGLIAATRLETVPVSVASFNQDGQVPGRSSPDLLYAGDYAAGAVAEALKAIDLPRRPNGRYADADFHGALQGAIATLLGGREGVIWMITNNKNAPNNAADVVANTRGFYDLLRQSDFITRIVAYPLRMKVSGSNFSENGFIVYGIAYGEAAARALDVIVSPDAPLRGLINDPPVTLKPIAPEVVQLRLALQQPEEGVTAGMTDGVLVVDGLSGGNPHSLVLNGHLRNVAYPKKIVRADVTPSWTSGSEVRATFSAEPNVIENVATGEESAPIALRLDLAAIDRPPGLAGLFESEALVDGVMRISLNGLDFDLDDRFVEKTAALFGGDILGEGQRRFVEEKLPAIFFDFRSVAQAVEEVPVRLVVRYSPWPLYAGGAALVAALGLAAAAVFLLARPRAFVTAVGGARQSLRLKPGQSVTVEGLDGQRYRVTGRVLRPHSVTPAD